MEYTVHAHRTIRVVVERRVRKATNKCASVVRMHHRVKFGVTTDILKAGINGAEELLA